LTDSGELDLVAAEELVRDGRVTFAAIAHVSNVLGTINDIPALVTLLRRANENVVIHIDGTQGVPHLPVSFRDLDVDFYAFTGHKMLGPTGIGVLVGKPERLDAMDPFLAGGDMITDVTLTGATWNTIPHKFEAGTPMIAEAAGLGAAVTFLQDVGLAAIRQHEQHLTGVFLDALQDVDGITLYGPKDTDKRSGAISFMLDGVHPHDIGAMLGSRGVCVRVGHHCAKPLMRCLEVNATVRASLYLYNDEDDLEPFITGLRDARAFFAR
jgi:cysteine desulfurase/selenocysteine lyase